MIELTLIDANITIQFTCGMIFFRHNNQLLIKNKKYLPVSPPQSTVVTPVGTTQFGASLQFIKENNNGDPIPPILRQCVEFLDTPDGMVSR